MRKRRLKLLYKDIENLSLPEVEYMQHKKTGQIVLSRSCKRFYRQMAKMLWLKANTVLKIDPEVLEKHKELAVPKPVL